MQQADYIYLDYAAATPLDPAVLASMQPFFSQQFYNPSALYQPAQAVKQAVEAARAQVAACLGARPTDIIFTAGGTEANNLALQGVLRQFPDGKLIVSAIEHDSVLRTAQQLGAAIVPVTSQGIVDVAALEALIGDETVLISCMYASNEVGTLQPLRAISQLVARIRRDRQRRGVTMPLYLHTDAAQAAGLLDIHAARLGVDLLTLNAGKIYGPKQSGALYVHHGVRLQPQLWGGGQERGLRSGTENVAGVVGLAAALTQVQAARQGEAARLAALQQSFFAQLNTALPQAVINGSRTHRLPTNVHVTLPGHDNERLLLQLEAAGILCAAGSACSASSDVPSHVLRAMGMSDADARSSLRFTMGRGTTQAHIDKTVAILATLIAPTA